MRTALLFGFAMLCSAATYGQFVTINVYSELIEDESGNAAPTTGLIFLAVDTSNDGFSQPTPTSFFSSADDQIISKWATGSFGQPGVLQDTTNSKELSGAWNSGDALRLYWYPSLGVSATDPGAAGIHYGSYSGTAGVNGSDAWTTPNPGTSRDLKFFTADATFLNMGGAELATTGEASLTVVPEPGAYTGVFAGLCLAGGMLRRLLQRK